MHSARFLVQLGLLAAAYFAVAKLALAMAIAPGYATPIWPGSGLALAALLLGGNRLWPGIWLGSAAANLTIEGSLVASALQAILVSALYLYAIEGKAPQQFDNRLLQDAFAPK